MLLVLVVWHTTPAMAGEGTGAPAAEARAILDATGVPGGVVVHVGCRDGWLTAALHASDAYVVHGLARDAATVEKARATIRSQGLYGPVSVDTFDGRRLPYVDNLVNLVVADDLAGIAMDDVMRVLAPGGVAMVAGKKTVKPWPDDIDEWTHFLHDASGNAVADDTVVATPHGVRWLGGPKRARDHDALASLSAMTSSGGRLFYIFDEGHTSLIHRPAVWKLIARDAFNGTPLWKRDIGDWITTLHYFRSGPVHVARRLVSVGNRVYATLGLEAPVSALDAATGKTVRTYAGSEKTEEILVQGGTLLAVVGDPSLFNRLAPDVWNYWEHRVDGKPQVAKAIVAYEADTGKRLWRREGQALAHVAPLSLCAVGAKVFYLDNEHLWCLDLATGKPLWQAPFATRGLFLRNYAPTVIARDEAVVCLTGNRLAAFATADGKPLWNHDRGALGFASPGDLFVVGDLVWVLPGIQAVRNPSAKATRGKEYQQVHYLGNGGAEFWGMDLMTGEVKRTLGKQDVWPGGHHHRCYRNKATTRFAVCGRRGIEFVDLAGSDHVRNWWIRGECQYGVLPCNGMVYRPPDPCRCFNYVKFNGLSALTAGSSLDEAVASASADRLVTGPAYGQAGQPAPAAAEPVEKPKDALWAPPAWPAHPEDWPTYRHDITRSGASPTTVPADLAPVWKTDLGGRLTGAVVADGRLFVAAADRHTVHCLDAETGKPAWTFTAGGRIDSPPTVAGGQAIFGSADGHVYAVRVRDGELAWRFRAAPLDRRMGALGGLESVWPASGSVLVLDGAVYVAAGRSTYLDGGIWVVALDARTGKKRHEVRLTADAASAGNAAHTGALADVLVSDGTHVNMRQVQFEKDLVQKEPAKLATLFTTTGLLEDCWFHRQNWHLSSPAKIRSTGKAAVSSAANRGTGAAIGKLLVFTADCVYGVQSPYTFLKHTKSMWPPTHEGHLHQKYARYKPESFPTGVWLYAQANTSKRSGEWQRTTAKDLKPKPGHKWKRDLPLQIRALVLAGRVLVAAGWLDAVGVNPPGGDPVPGAEARPAQLWVLSTEDGRPLAEHPLDARPVFDGMAVARGRLYLAMADGSVRCFGKK